MLTFAFYSQETKSPKSKMLDKDDSPEESAKKKSEDEEESKDAEDKKPEAAAAANPLQVRKKYSWKKN